MREEVSIDQRRRNLNVIEKRTEMTRKAFQLETVFIFEKASPNAHAGAEFFFRTHNFISSCSQ